jgi:glycerol uptake facilitator-like aquaporin
VLRVRAAAACLSNFRTPTHPLTHTTLITRTPTNTHTTHTTPSTTTTADHGTFNLVNAAIGNGLGLVVVLAMIASATGGHVNPAVTLGVYVYKLLRPDPSARFGWFRAVAYVAAQLLGAVVGAAMLKSMLPVGHGFAVLGAYTAGPAAAQQVGKAFAMEMVAAFLFVAVILVTAVSNETKSNFAPGAAITLIGAVIAVCVVFIGPFTGCGVNPARAFGPAVVFGNFTNQVVYWAAPLLGAVFAAVWVRYVQESPAAKAVSEVGDSAEKANLVSDDVERQ